MTTNDDNDLSVEAILEALEAAHAGEEPVVVAGLRERKKRRARQRISNVATALFLAEGFDNVNGCPDRRGKRSVEQTVFTTSPPRSRCSSIAPSPTSRRLPTQSGIVA